VIGGKRHENAERLCNEMGGQSVYVVWAAPIRKKWFDMSPDKD
jgi:hypothetical protein